MMARSAMLRQIIPALFFLHLCVPITSMRLRTRDLSDAFLDCYDYIVVGGGVSGLVVANRLTEDPNITVLVLESGDLDHSEDFIMYPFGDGDGLNTMYDWNLWTTPQTSLDGKPRPYDMGRGIGGGSIINGMVWSRGGKADFDAWVALGNPGWGWDDLLPYFKKAENYTDDVNSDFSRELYVEPNLSTHGTDGYVHVSYPRYFYNQSRLFLDGLQELGIPILTEPNNGTAAGGMLIPNTLDPDSQTRSYARTGYYDKFIDSRPNLHVATGQLAIRLRIEPTLNVASRDYPAGLWVSGVEFISDGSLVVHNVSCAREVILAAGAVHTPQILELSGIGSADVLNQHNVPVVLDLPGVGNNFQDHPYVGVVYYVSNASYLTTTMIENNPGLLNETEREYFTQKTGPFTTGPIDTIAFPSLPSITRNWTNMMADASTQKVTQYLLPNLDPTIIAGYEAQKVILVDLLSSTDVGSYELLSSNIGLLAVSVMHPFSRGSVHIQSTNPLQQPSIDPRYCSNPLDLQLLVEALLFNNRLTNTTSMKILQPTPYSPFFQNATAATLMPEIRSGIRTEFHGSGSTSMLPRELGGVVDPHLRVYGTKNLRIVDAGIISLVPAAHLQAPVYAIAEKAADIIKADNMGLTTQGCGANAVFARAGPVTSNVSTNGSGTMRSSPVIQNFMQFLNSSFISQFKTTNVVLPAAPTSSTEELFDPAKIAMLGQGTATTPGQLLGNPIGMLASALLAKPSSVVAAVGGNSSLFSILG